MKLAGVRRSTGAPVTLLFVETGVHVLDYAGRRGRMFRIAGGAVFGAVGLAAIGASFAHFAMGIVLVGAASMLFAGAGALAVTAVILNARAERYVLRSAAPPDIAFDKVEWARSDHQQRGVVMVVLGMSDGTTEQFSAAGVTGARLATLFGRLLGVVPPVADVAGSATTNSHQ